MKLLPSLALAATLSALLVPATAQTTLFFNNGENNGTEYDISSSSLTLNIVSGTASQNGIVSGSGTVIKNGAGTIHLTAANTYSGGTAVDAGTLSVANAGNLGSGDITASGGGDLVATLLEINGPRTVTVTGAGSTLATGYLWFNRDNSADLQTFNVTAGGAVTIDSTLSLADLNSGSTGNLNVTGSGSSLSSGGNSYIGYSGHSTATVGTGGTIAIGGLLSIATLGGSHGTFNLDEGGTLQVGGSGGIAIGSGTGVFNANGGTLQVVGSDLTTSAAMTLGDASTSTVDTNALNATLSGPLSGSGALAKTGAGTLTLGVANTYSGDTTVSAGTLRLGDADALQNSTATLSGGTLSFGALTSANLGGLAGSSALALENDSAAAVAVSVGANNASTTYAGALSGSGSLTKVGSGILTLSGANTFSGQTTLQGGTLLIGSEDALKFSIVQIAGGTLSFGTETAVSLGGLSAGAGSYALKNALDEAVALTVGYANANTVFDGYFSASAGSLIKTGSGDLRLGDFNYYTGSTTIEGGTLTISADQNLGAAPGSPTANHLVFNGGILVNQNGGSALTLATNRGITLDENGGTLQGAFTSDGIIAGTGDLTKSGSGALTLGGANTFSGQTTLSASGGILVLNHAQALQNSTLIFDSNAVISVDSGITTLSLGGLAGSSNFAMAPDPFAEDSPTTGILNGTFDLNVGANGDDTTYSGVLSGENRSLTKVGAGTLTLSGGNTYSGNTTVTGGKLAISSDGNLGDAINSPTLTLSGGTLQTTGTFGLDTSRSVILGPTGTFETTSGTLTVDGPVSGGQLIKTGAGTLALTGTLDYTGGTTIAGGTLVTSPSSNFEFTGRLTVTAPGIFDLHGNDQIVASLTGDGTVALGSKTLTTGDASNDAVWSGSITGSGNLEKTGNGIFTLGGNNTYAGTTTVSGGTLRLGSATALSGTSAVSVGPAVTLDLDNQSVTLTALDAEFDSTLALGSAALTTGDAGNHEIAADITGTGGSLDKIGAGILTVSGTNTYTGPTTVSAGTLRLGSSGALSGTSSLTVDAGATLDLNTQVVTLGAIGGSGILDLNAAQLTLGNGSDHTLATALTGAGEFLKAGSGNLTLSADNSAYTGTVEITAGTLTLASANALGSPANGTTVDSGATLALTNDISLADAVDNAGTVTNVSGTNTVSGVLSGSGALTVAAGQLTLSGNNSYDGATAITGGTLQLGSAAALGATSSVDVAASGTLDLNDYATNIADLDGAGDIALGSATLTTGDSGDHTLSGVISGIGGSIVKADSGTLTLSGSNTYSGGTTVNGGALAISANANLGAVSGGLTLDGGALVTTADLTWNATRALTLGAGHGTFSPASATTLTIDRAITGSGDLIKSDAGTLVLAGTNTYSGATTLTGGTLSIAADSALGTAPIIATPGHLTFDGGTLATTATFTLDANRGLTLATGGGTLDTATGTTLTYDGALAGTGALTKQGVGTLTLSGANTRTAGTTTISAGTLEYANRSAYFGSSTSANPYVLSAGTLALPVGDGAYFSDADVSAIITPDSVNGAYFYNNGTLELNTDHATGGAFTLLAAIVNHDSGDNAVSLRKSGAGTLTLSGNNSYSGTTTVTAGTLVLAGTNTGTGAITVSGGSLQIGDGISPSTSLAAATLASDTTVTFDLGSSLTFAGSYSGTGGLTKTGFGTLTLSGANTFTGDTHLDSGTLELTHASALQSSTVNPNGGFLTFNGVNSATFGGLAGSGSLNLPATSLTVGGNDADTAYSGTLYGSSATFIKTGTGNLTFSGSFSESGTVVRLDAGTFTLGSNSTLQSAAVDLNGGALSFGALTSVSLGSLAGSGNLTLANTAETPAAVVLSVGDNGNSTTYSGILSGAGSLTKTGFGTLTLSGANTFTGTTTLSDGTLALTPTGSLAGDLNLNSGTLDLANATGLQSSTVTLNGGFLMFNGVNSATFGGLAGSGSLTLPGTSLTVGGNDADTTYSGTLSGSSATFIKTGTGNLTFSGSFNDSGTVVRLDAGTFTLGSNSTLQSAAVDLNGGALSFGALTSASLGSLAGSGNLTLANTTPAAVALSVGDNGNSTTYSGILSGAGSLTKTGFGTLTLSGANIFTGTTTVEYGTLELTSSASLAGDLTLGSSGTLSLANATGLQTSTVTLNGGTLSYNGISAVTFGGLAGSYQLDLPSTSLTVGGNDADTSYSGTIRGTAVVIKAGTGNFTFSGNFDNSATIRLDAGTLTLGNTSALGYATVDLNGGALDFGNLTSATLDGLTGSGNLALTNHAQVPAAVALTLGYNSGSHSYDGTLSGAGSLTKTGYGTFTLTGAQTFTGDTTLSDGTLALGASASLAGDVNLDSGTLLLANPTGLQNSTVHLNGGSLGYSGVSAATFGGLAGSYELQLPSTSLTFGGNDADTSYSGTIRGSAPLIKAGDGTFTFNGSFDDSSAQLRLDAGIFALGNGSALASATVNLNGGDLSFGALTSASLGSLAGSGNLTLTNTTPAAVALSVGDNGADTTYSGILSGSGALTKTGFGTLTLSGANTFTGATTIEGGTVTLADSNALQSSTLVTSASGTVDFGNLSGVNLGGLSGNGNLSTMSPALALNVGANSQDTTYSGVLSGAISLTKSGSGTLTLSGANTYADGTTVTAGTLVATDATQFGSGAINVSSSGAIELSSATAFLQDVTITGNDSRLTGFDNSSELNEDSVFDPDNYTGFLAADASRTVTISDGGALTGTLIAFDANSAGDMTVNLSNGGRITVNNTLVVGATGGGATSLNVTGPGSSIAAENGGLVIGFNNGAAAANVTVANGGRIVADGIQVGAAFSGSAQGNLTINDGGSVTVGQIWLNSDPGQPDTLKLNSGGTLEITGGADALSTSPGNSVAFNGGTLQLTTNTFSTGVNATLGAGTTSTINTNGVAASWSGVLSGSGSLTKSGANTLTLSGANTYTGTTAVFAGTLVVNGSLASSAVTVNSGAKLGGRGTVGALSIASGGILAPGNSPGTLSAGDTTFAGGGIFEFQINDATGTAGTNWDLLNIAGTLDLSQLADADGFRFTFSLVSLTAENAAGLLAHFNPAQNYAFTVASATSGILGFNGDAFSIDRANFVNSAPGTWSLGLGNDSHDLNLSYTASAIPEPSTYAALFGLAALGLAGWRRRLRP